MYSIWICLDRIPNKLQNTISYYKIQNYKNEGFEKVDIKINENEADLIEVVIVRLGREMNEEKGLVDFLYGVFSGDKERVSSYISNAGRNAEHEEVTDMLNLVEYAEENGMKKGRKEGETRLGALIKILLKDKRYADAEKVAEDEEFRKQLYKEYKI